MTNNFNLSLPELILFLSAAIVLGITIRLFLSMRKDLKINTPVHQLTNQEREELEKKLSSDLIIRDKQISSLKEKLKTSGEKVKMMVTKTEELNWQQKRFESIKDQLEKKITDLDKRKMVTHIATSEKRGLIARG